MDEKLRVEVGRWGGVVLCRVVEQPEDVRGKGVLCVEDGFRLRSVAYGALELDNLYINGDNSAKDGRKFCLQCRGEDQAAALVEKVKRAVRGFNESRRPLSVHECSPTRIMEMVE